MVRHHWFDSSDSAVPGTPTNAKATAGNARATVGFTAPTSNGGSPITGYTVTSRPGGQTASGPASPIAVTGLTNGTAYTFTVKAANRSGTGPASTPSNSVTPSGEVVTSTAFPLKISAGDRHLEDQNGVPFLMVGDSPWGLITELCQADVITYLDDRQARGYNTIMVSLINVGGSGLAHAPNDCNGDPPFTTPGDFSTPNEAYFAYADWVIKQAAARGILVLLAPAYMGYGCGTANTDGWLHQMIASGNRNMQSFGAYLGNRYAGFPNILWVEGCDQDAAQCGGGAVLNSMVAGIKSADNIHLHTANCIPYSSAYDCYGGSSWLNVNSGYSDCTSSAGADYADYNQALMPLFYLEGFYENDSDPNHRASGQQCLDSQSYWAVLGGQIGALFGNYPIYMFAGGWKSALGSRGSINQAHFGAFFRSIPWYDLVPDYSHTVLVNGYGNLYDSSYVGCARTVDGSYVVAYLPTQSTVTIDMSQISTSQVTAQWFNPSTAAYTTIGIYSNTGTRNFTPPASGDWVLLLSGQ